MEEQTIATRLISRTAKNRKRKAKQQFAESDSAKTTTSKSRSKSSDGKRNMLDQSGAEQLFRQQHTFQKGIRKNTKSAKELPLMSVDDLRYYENIDKSFRTEHTTDIKPDIDRYLNTNMVDILWPLQCGFNVLIYGIGSKKEIMDKTASTLLQGEDVLEINGQNTSTSNEIIESLLNAISSTILKVNDEIRIGSHGIVDYAVQVTECLSRHYGRETVVEEIHEMVKEYRNNKTVIQPIHNIVDAMEMSTDIPNQSSNRMEVMDSSRRLRDRNYHGKYDTKCIYDDPTNVQWYINPQWYGRYSHGKSRLYLIIHHIDGLYLQSETAQCCLSILASCNSVSIIASCNHLNTASLWDKGMLYRYNWHLLHLSTFIPHSIPTVSPFVKIKSKTAWMKSNENDKNNNNTNQSSDEIHGNALNYILKSLTDKHHDLLKVICKLVTDAAKVNNEKKTQKKEEISNKKSTRNVNLDVESNETLENKNYSADEKKVLLQNILQLCKKRMIANNFQELRILLREYIDHNVLSTTHDQNNLDSINVLLSDKDILKFGNAFK